MWHRATKITGRFLATKIGASLVLLPPFETVLLGQSTSWTHDPMRVGDWFDSGNWSNGVPASDRAALMTNSGTAQINGGTATAAGINSSKAAGSTGRGIGYAEASDLGVGTFLGVGVDSTAVLI